MESAATDQIDERDRLDKAANGDGHALGQVLDGYRRRLLRMIRLRLDRRLQSRLDASDVIQETFVEASRRLKEYLANPEVPFGVWLRFLTGQKILQLHRHHLGVQARAADREISLHHGPMPQATSAALAEQLMGAITSPSQGFLKAEMRVRLQESLNAMEVMDREILALRHFEQMPFAEAAQVLGIKRTAACNRYVRALKRLKSMLADDPSDLRGF